MLGEVVEGEVGERVQRAGTKFKTFMELIEKGVVINASKDCSRGGWFGNMCEMLVKSRKGISITSVPYQKMTRYMGTYLVSVPRTETKKIVEIATKNKCPVVEMGEIVDEPEVLIGEEVYVSKEKMQEMIKDFPFKKPKK